MSTDWKEKEREFLTSLEADTGRDLGQWMRVISAQNLAHRNDIIDWLRQRGFPFSRASWLERIHHNAGRPIYLDPSELQDDAAAEEVLDTRIAVGAGRTVALPAGQGPVAKAAPAGPAATPHPSAAQARPEPPRVVVSATTGGTPAAPPPTQSADAQPGRMAERGAAPVDLEPLLAKAKAYRPLAAFLIREITAAIPGAGISVGPGHALLSLDGGPPFALLAASGKDIRLALRLTEAPAIELFGPVRLPVTLAKPAAGMTHMAVLNDARQIEAELINLIRRAAGA